MALHFPRAEFAARQAAARAALGEAGLDALVLFAQESLYYLTGFDSSGYVFFQCGVLTAAERPLVLLTRRPDLEQARRTSVIEDIRLWYDAEGANPALDLRAILADAGCRGGRVGVELATYGLTGANWERIRRALDGWCRVEDASDVVRTLRLVKSPAELAYVRRAAALADDALGAMVAATRPGAFEGDILTAGQSVIFRGGGDVAPSGPVLGAGERALLVRSSTGPEHLGERDQLTIEFAATYRRYNACLMRTLPVGGTDPRQARMFEVTRDALSAMTETATPGRPLGEIDEAHRRVYDAAGFGPARMAACGYSLGATYRPTWMDVPPMLYAGNPTTARPGMVLFLHAILADARAGLAMSLGHTIVISETGREVLSRLTPVYEACR
ncbi:MAG TPA: Xaa-Pro peptidase family protein [Methylomirabilota bacterium]|jgi:Xaa-Pro dipeptidase|nr:Xaa-Pro peptidase family protein [Methylomirabilota bacterium]